jgi:hypothetical protein
MKGLRVSKGTVFLFTVIPTRSRDSSASLPVSGVSLRFTSMRWLSVPPETSRSPRAESVPARAFALATIRRW